LFLIAINVLPIGDVKALHIHSNYK
jgi:hypothetical protein